MLQNTRGIPGFAHRNRAFEGFPGGADPEKRGQLSRLHREPSVTLFAAREILPRRDTPTVGRIRTFLGLLLLLLLLLLPCSALRGDAAVTNATCASALVIARRALPGPRRASTPPTFPVTGILRSFPVTPRDSFRRAGRRLRRTSSGSPSRPRSRTPTGSTRSARRPRPTTTRSSA